MINLLATPVELDGFELVVEGEAYHHAFHAARGAVGDAVRVVDGRGRARDGEVVSVDRRRARVRLGASAPAREPRLALELLVAAPRPSRASWLVEKGTELGVRAFRFLDCERSARELDEAALDRLRRVARAAVEQCGRSWLPEVTLAAGLEEELARHAGAIAFVLDPQAATAAAEIGVSTGAAVLLIGPEGGFSSAELEVCARAGATSVRLGPSILRLETAALAGAAWLLLAAEGGG